MRIDYKFQDKFDFILFFAVVLLVGFGLVAIYSSTLNNPSASGNFQKQVVWGIAALIIFLITYSIPTNTFKIIATPSYLISISFLVVVIVLGRRISGAKSWLDFGPLGFQPSEFAKIGTILALASFLSRKNTDIDSFKDIVLSLIIGCIPVGLILLEPDMGTAIVFMGLMLTMIFWKGISLFGLFIVLSPGFIAISSLFGMTYFIIGLLLVVVGLFIFKKIFFSMVLF